MATKNIVPRTGSEGEIGTSAKPWEKAHIDEVTATQVSSSYLSASSDARVAGNSHFGSELTNTHIFTGSFHQTGSGATSTFKDQIIVSGSVSTFSDNGLTLQSTGTATPSGATTTHNFLNVTDADGVTASTFKYTNENPSGGAPPDFFQKTLNISASSGTDVLITAGSQTAPYGQGGGITLDGALLTVNGTDSVMLSSGMDVSIDATNTAVNGNSVVINSIADASIDCIAGNVDIKSAANATLSGSTSLVRAGSYVYMDTNFLLVQGKNTSDDEVLYYASPSSYGVSHLRYLSYGYDNTYNCARFTAGYGGSGGDNQFIWYVSNDTSSEHPVMLLDFSGNLGIGTVTPTKTLDVVGNISASQEISASSFWGDGSGLTNVPTAETDTLATVTARGATTTTPVYFNTHITASSGIFSGPLHVLGSSVHSGTIDMYAGGGLYFFGEDGTSSGSMTPQTSGGGLRLQVNPLSPGLLIDSKTQIADNAEITGSLIIRESDGLTIQKGNGNTIGSIYHSGSATFDISAVDALKLSAADDINMVPAAGKKVSVDGEFSASLGITGSEVHTPTIYATSYHAPGIGSPTYQINNTGMFIYNDLSVGLNSNPDTFVVDRDAQKVGVNCDIADLPDANFSVSGSTALGNLVTDTHIITGSTEIYTEAQTGLQVLQNVASSGYPVARFENTNAGGSTYIETHGTNQGGIKMYRGGTLRATIDTAGNAFTMYAGNPVPSNLGFMIQSGKAEFKETTADNFTGTKGQINISASSGPAIRIDSGATPQETTFKVEDYTTTMVSASADLLTMDDTNAPPTPSNAAHMYAKSGEMYVMDTAGNETQISPHGEDGEWQYFSRNTRTGKVVRIRMEKMIRKLEELTGETFIEEE